jgi:hypothetical protein
LFDYSIKHDFPGLFAYFDSLFLPRFSVSHMGITRQELIYWKQKKILGPEETNENHEMQRSWVKVNFFSYAWIRLVTELRALNVPLETIVQLKSKMEAMREMIFSSNFLDGVKEEAKQSFGDLHPELLIEVQEFLQNTVLNRFSEFAKQLTIFNIIVLYLVSNQKPVNLLLQTNGEFMLLNPVEGPEDSMKEEYMSFTARPFVSIPLVSILDNFIENPHIKTQDKREIYNLSKHELFVLDLLRKEGIKEIRIRLNNKRKGQILIDTTRERNPKDMENRVRSLLKNGEFQDIRIYAENGNLLLCEEVTRTLIKTSN